MTLFKWLKSENLTQADFALRVNVSQARIAQVSKGGTNSLSLASVIVRETRGEVDFSDLGFTPHEAAE